MMQSRGGKHEMYEAAIGIHDILFFSKFFFLEDTRVHFKITIKKYSTVNT